MARTMRKKLRNQVRTNSSVRNLQGTFVAFGQGIATHACPCGYLGDPSGRCRCTPNSLQHYQARISGPLLDRIDLRVQLTRVVESEWQAAGAASGPNTAEAAALVLAARCVQLERSGVLNAALGSAQLAEDLCLSIPARQLLLAASAAIAPCHVAEALQLRRAS